MRRLYHDVDACTNIKNIETLDLSIPLWIQCFAMERLHTNDTLQRILNFLV